MEAVLKNKNVLCDIHPNKSGLRLLTESTEIEKYKGNTNAIGILCGPCADFTVQTENGHFYSERLWQLVVDSDYVKEAIETKTLFGEIDHPEERLDLKAEYAAINCTKLWIDKENQCLMGCFDILPTEKGRLLKSLCDYGSILGVSSRGIGDLTYDEQKGNIVNEDTYLFVCFDVVVQPASKNARQSYKSLTEQKKNGVETVFDVLSESIKSSTSESELSNTTSLIEKFNLGCDELTSLIEDKRNRLKNNTNNSIIKINKKLQEDLEQAYDRIRSLETQNDSNNLLAEISFLRSQLAFIKENITSQAKDKDSLLKEVKKLNKLLKEKENSLVEQNTLLTDANETLKQKIVQLESQKSDLISKNKSLQETVDYAVSFVNKCKKSYKALTESFTLSKNKNSNLATKLQEVQNKLNESTKNLANAISQSEETQRLNKALREEYLRQQEDIYGKNLSMTRRKMNEAKSLKDIDLLISQETSFANSARPSIKNAITESENIYGNSSQNPGEISVIREALRANRKL